MQVVVSRGIQGIRIPLTLVAGVEQEMEMAEILKNRESLEPSADLAKQAVYSTVAEAPGVTGLVPQCSRAGLRTEAAAEPEREQARLTQSLVQVLAVAEAVVVLFGAIHKMRVERPDTEARLF